MISLHKNISYIFFCSLLFLTIISCGTDSGDADDFPSPGVHQFQIESGGLEREYFIHIPESFDETAEYPVVFVFHGGGGQAKNTLENSSWPEKANSENFMAVFPNGSRANPDEPSSFTNNQQSWNDGSGREAIGAVERGVDDIEFVQTMIADIRSRLTEDPPHLFATGFSNGASMSFRIGRELHNNFTAIAPVAGTDWLPDLIPDNPPGVLYITGTDDPLNPFEGGDIFLGGNFLGTKPPVEEMIREWTILHGCGDANIETANDIRSYDYNCNTTPESISMLALIGHGHHWPGSSSQLPAFIAGPNSTDLDATATIWEYFEGFINR